MVRKWLFGVIVFFSIGEIAALNFSETAPGKPWVLLVLSLTLLIPAGLLILRRQYSGAGVFLCLFCGLGGWILAGTALHQADGLGTFINQEILLTGQVEPGSIKFKKEGTSFLVRVEGVKYLRADLPVQAEKIVAPQPVESWLKVRGQVRIFVKEKQEPEERKELFFSGKVVVRGLLKPLIFTANPGSWDGAGTAKLTGLAGRMAVNVEEIRVFPRLAGWAEKVQGGVRSLRQQLVKQLPAGQGALLLGMVLGGTLDLDPDIADLFRDNGLAHLLAVSGTHVALVLTVLLFGLRKLTPVWRNLLLTAFLLFYSCICGWQPSVIRASIMGLVLLWARREKPSEEKLSGREEALAALAEASAKGELSAGRRQTLQAALAEQSRKKLDGSNLLLLTGLGMLLVKPLWLFNPGFQLSFLTMAGLLNLQPKLKAYLPEGWPELLRETLALTLTAQVITLPVLVWYFHRISLIAIFSNLFLLPALSLAVIIFTAGLFFYSWWPVAGLIIMNPALLLVRGSLQIGTWLLQIPGAVCDAAHWGWLRFGAYYLVLAAFFDLGPFKSLSRQRRRRTVGLGLFVFIGLWSYQVWRPQPLSLHIMDVGQGDAALVSLSSGAHVLIDTGGWQGDADVGRQIVVPYLRYLGVKRVQALILSHGDHDHAGGAVAVAESLPVDNLFLGPGALSQDVKKLKTRLPAQTKVHQVDAGSTYTAGNGRLEFLTGKAPGEKPEDANAASLVLRLSEGGHKILFMGDAPSTLEQRLNPSYLPAEVLKVGHHGSDSSSSADFLRLVQPKLATISVGQDNKYGHPSPEALWRLRETGALVLRTDILGAVKVNFDSDGLKWYSYKYQPDKF